MKSQHIDWTRLMPALRGCLAPGGRRPPLLRFTEAAPENAHALPDIPPETDDDSLIESLREALRDLPSDAAALSIAGANEGIVIDRTLPSGRVAGRVALVTGAAQGFGREIAADLLREGACVVLADINANGLNEAVGALGAAGNCATRLRAAVMDVASTTSVAEAVRDTVLAFGGIDLLVANAGVLRAGSVKTLAERDFDFVTKVNYKGFFVCVQAVAPVMALQTRAGGADCWTDIVQINSKSGLEGSNRNGAYAGSKFGGIGLTQSFALELVADRIKVNAVCPGNFFDGPLWSDPDNGLFVQYLRSGKVPGAQTVADVKRFYESKVPMGRGCTTADVMTAIYYLIAQRYETGQALPVTGGQVMLS